MSISKTVTLARQLILDTARANSTRYSDDMRELICFGIPTRSAVGKREGPGKGREKRTSPIRAPAVAGSLSITASTRAASEAVSAITVTQSRLRHAVTTPVVLTRPTDGFSVTTPLNAAATPLHPSVSVPSENGTTHRDTTAALPEDEPPLICSAE